MNKDHVIERGEFRLSMNRVLNLTDKEIDVLIDRFYAEGQETLDYVSFMGIIHSYADKVIRS